MRYWLAGAAVLASALAAGCSPGSQAPPSAATSSTGSTGSPTSPAGPTTEPSPAPPAPPVIGTGPCPYLDQTYIEETIGQRIARIETVTVEGQPLADCGFFRPNGTAAAGVDLTTYADPIAAQNAALAAFTPQALPVTDIGDYGGVIVSANQTLLAFTTGPLLVVVIINQESSLEAREIAATVLAALPPA